MAVCSGDGRFIRMQRVLVIAPYFPPMGGPGVQRSTRLVQRLPGLGFEPIVLTIAESDVALSVFPRDATLMKGLENVEIHRVATREPRWMMRRIGKGVWCRVIRFIFYPLVWEDCALWPLAAFRQARHLVKARKITVAYVSCAPFSGLLLGLMLKALMGIRVVADFRDPFTESYTQEWPSRLHWLACRGLEHVVVGRCDRLIVNTPAVEKEYLRRGLVSARRVQVITNGFD